MRNVVKKTLAPQTLGDAKLTPIPGDAGIMVEQAVSGRFQIVNDGPDDLDALSVSLSANGIANFLPDDDMNTAIAAALPIAAGGYAVIEYDRAMGERIVFFGQSSFATTGSVVQVSYFAHEEINTPEEGSR